MRCLAAAALASLSLLGVAHAEDATEFDFLPDGAQTPVLSFGFSASGQDEHFGFDLSATGPIRTLADGWLSFDIAASGQVEDGSLQSYGASAGLFWRVATSGNHAFGLNTYLDFGRSDAGGFEFGQASLGAEYRMNLGDGQSHLLAGANYYLPFEDYTDPAINPLATDAPRLGADLYLSFDQGYAWGSLRGTLGGFQRVGTDFTSNLYGYELGLDAITSLGLPDGMSASFGLGMTGHNTNGFAPDLGLSLALNWTIGGGPAPIIPRDYWIEFDSTPPDVVCPTGKGQMDTTPLILPQVVRLTPPRRHIGLPGVVAPIEGSQPSMAQINFGYTFLVATTQGGVLTFTATGPDAALLARSFADRVFPRTRAIPGRNQWIDIAPGSYTLTMTTSNFLTSIRSGDCSGPGITMTGQVPLNAREYRLEFDIANEAQATCQFVLNEAN